MFGDMISGVMDVVALVALFGLSILVHEMAHFLTALKCGMKVEAFSIGFGPAIWKKNIRGTVFKIGVIPVGGYVALPQLDPAGMSKVQGKESGGEEALPPVAPWKKILVSVSGSAGNVVLAGILAWVVFLSPVASEPETGAVVGAVQSESAAYAAGVRAGDRIVAMNGERVETWHDYGLLCVLLGGNGGLVTLSVDRDGERLDFDVPVVEDDIGSREVEGIDRAHTTVAAEVVAGGPAEAAGMRAGDIILELDGVEVLSASHFIAMLQGREDEDLPIAVMREGERVVLGVTPVFNKQHGRTQVGIIIASAYQGVAPWMQHRQPWDQVKGDVQSIWRVLVALVTPKESRQAARGLGGPVMIVATLWISIKASFINAIGFLRFLNVNLAILNLLPIPVLDGGHVIFSLWEWIFRRPVNRKVVNFLINVFAALIILAFVVLTYRDFFRIARIARLFGE